MTQFDAQNREAIYVALVAQLKAALGSTFTTISRKYKIGVDIPAELQPALFVLEMGERREAPQRGIPGRLILSAMLVVHCIDDIPTEPMGEETSLVATKINEFLRKIDDALAPSPATGVQTLGGLVSHCWVEGETLVDHGFYGPQAFAGVPVQILVP